jgi:hypothetical protein
MLYLAGICEFRPKKDVVMSIGEVLKAVRAMSPEECERVRTLFNR